jgi:hypothetical protein
MRDAPKYLGMDRHAFSELARPFLTEIPIGIQGIAFDRLEMDAWVEEYVRCNGRRPKPHKVEDDICQNATKCRGSVSKAVSGKLRKDVNTSKAVGSVKAREKLAELRQRNT